MELETFYKNKRVLITGNTGFKGSWLSLILQEFGANVFGYSLQPESIKNNYIASNVSKKEKKSYFEDIRDRKTLEASLSKINPNIIFHLAAQPLVKYSYSHPVDTYSTNVMGTVNLLDSSRSLSELDSILIITSDKCYENNESGKAFLESDKLGGFDPYSNSKACQELVSQSYRDSFFKDLEIQVSTARAGNVIGGGDWCENRIVPDIINSIQSNSTLILRNPDSTRPWQHVLEALFGYLTLVMKMSNNKGLHDTCWNFGPNMNSHKSVIEIVKIFEEVSGLAISSDISEASAHEANLLALDTSKTSSLLGIESALSIHESIQLTYDWYESYYLGKDMRNKSLQQIDLYKHILKG